jgi:hypothetical protein
LEDVGNDNEEVGRKSVSLAETIFAFDPRARNSIQDHRRMASVENRLNPRTPTIGESTGAEDGEEAGPVNRVESFPKVNFKDNGGGFSKMAAADKIGSIDNVLRDAASGQESRLIRVN